ncbi:MAG: tRNA (N6-threonylcarbamoyladenosine(37)-N6)-methyltransferase TrmO [Clostridia bacterium]|nr:tRNA (N6-threonylcarbamoyladenosine(37)-N6)-methyltransferase TrmO [Clostridia bacterium]
MEEFTIKPIAKIKSDFPDKFGIPRQSGIVCGIVSTVVFEKEFRSPEALRGIENCSHLWLIWQFSENVREGFSPTVRPPRLGGNERLGVFATRSPFRPNPLGLSCVKLLGVEKTENDGFVLLVEGADLMDGTPVYDIKPYLPYTDCRPEAANSFAPDAEEYTLSVEIPEKEAAKFPASKLSALKGVLAQDPRPAYKDDGEKIYGMRFAGFEIKFRVKEKILTVTSIEKDNS